jgi:hypothetical protein
MRRLKATVEMTSDGLKLSWTKRGARSESLGIAARIGAAGERAANTAR